MFDHLDRRDFLQLSAALAGAAVFGTESAQAAAPAHGLKKAVKYGMIGGNGTVLEKFQLVKDIGFEGVDIDRPLDHKEVLAAQDKTGLIVHGVVSYNHWKLPLSDPDPEVREAGRKSFEGSIRDAKVYGGTTVLLVPAVVNKNVSYADAYTRSQEQIRKALPVAEETGIKILFENVWNNFLLSPVEMVRYIDEFDSELVGCYFDVGNIVRYGWPEHWIQALGHRVGKLDVKEYSRKLENERGPRAGFGVELGEGDCDWPAVMRALSEIGFKGWATAEVRGGDRERLQEIHDRMDRIFASGAAAS